MTDPVRVYLAASVAHPLGIAAIVALARDARVHVVGVQEDRIDPDDLAAVRPDLLLSAAYRYRLPRGILTTPRLGAIGLHPSLLPRDRGSYPLWWALRRGDREAGLTAFHLRSKIDAGPVIAQRRVPIAMDDTFATLYTRVAAETGPILHNLVTAIVTNGLPAGEEQDEAQATWVPTPSLAPRAMLKAFWATRRALLAPRRALQHEEPVRSRVG